MSNSIQILGPRGNTLAVSASGTGHSLFLLHGFPLDHRMWQPQLAGLSDRFHVVAVHLRGFGASTLDEASYSLADLAQDIEFLRHHLAGDKPIYVAGLSLGGYVALEYWRQFPDALRGLILSNTKPTADSDAARSGRLSMAQQALESGTWEAVQPMLEKMLCQQTFDSKLAVVELVKAMMCDARPTAVAAAQHAMAARRDFSDLLAAIRVPTLVIAGEADPIAPASDTAAWAKQIPDSKLAVIASTGHLSPLESPAAYNQALLNFLNV